MGWGGRGGGGGLRAGGREGSEGRKKGGRLNEGGSGEARRKCAKKRCRRGAVMNEDVIRMGWSLGHDSIPHKLFSAHSTLQAHSCG